MTLPYDFFTRVDGPKKYVKYGDTDSQFIHLPDVKADDPQKAIEISEDISKKINDVIKRVLNSEILPKMGIDIQYNRTSFKTELVATAILFLETKKTYAYLQIAKEGKLFKKPEISYTNISVKSDLSPATKDFLKMIVEDVVLNINVPMSAAMSMITKICADMKQKIIDSINNYDFDYIGVRKKWGTSYKNEEPFQIIGMRLYNTIVNERKLVPMSGAVLIPIQIKNPSDFESKISTMRNADPLYLRDVPLTKINYLAIPYGYDKTQTKNAMEYFGICVNVDEVWSKVYSTQVDRIIKVQQRLANPLREYIS